MSATSPALNRDQRKSGPRRNHKRPSALTQAFDQRDLASKLALRLDPGPTAKLGEIRSCCAALRDINGVWNTCCDRIMVLQGRGKPKSVPARNDPGARKASKRTQSSGPIGLAPKQPTT